MHFSHLIPMLSKFLHNPRLLCFSTSYSSTSIFDGGTHRGQHQSEEQGAMKGAEWPKQKKDMTMPPVMVDEHLKVPLKCGGFFQPGRFSFSNQPFSKVSKQNNAQYVCILTF